MARVRLLNPEIYMDEEISMLSLGARWLFAGLWTIADREGRLEDLPNKIRAQLFPYEPELNVAAMLCELAAQRTNGIGFLTRYEVEGKNCIQINNFLRHQKPHPRETESRLPAPKASLRRTNDNLRNDKVAGKVVDPVKYPVEGEPRLALEEPSMPIPSGIRGDDEIDELNAIWSELRGGPHRYIGEILQTVRHHGMPVVRLALRSYLDSKREEKFKGSPGDFGANVLMYLPRKNRERVSHTAAELEAMELKAAGL